MELAIKLPGCWNQTAIETYNIVKPPEVYGFNFADLEIILEIA